MSSQRLRELMGSDIVFAPGVWDGLSARMAEQAGFGALCASGFAIAASLGMPDAELYTMSENLDAVRRIREASSLPIVADVDTGYGNAVNAARTARKFADAGVAAIFMEDQEAPKRCPLCVDEPVPVIPLAEGVGKVRAVCDAVGDRVVVVARTDSVGEEALRRAEAYVAAGAEMIMPVSKTFSTLEEWRRCHEAAGVPLVAALSAWTWLEREAAAPDALRAAGIGLAFLPTQLVLAVSTALRDSLRRLSGGEAPAQVSGDYMSHRDFVDVIGFDQVEQMQREYLPAS